MFESTLSSLLFVILKVICWGINRLTQLFEVFSGLTKVTHNGEETFLFDVFFRNSTINNIYWGMALIGLAMCFGFAIFSAARKMFDMNNKNPLSTGQIVTETVKSFFLIISMNLILTLSITATDVLLRQVNYLFTKSDGLDTPEVMEYTDEQYAAMGRALSTIANYGMNPSYNSRYNVNDCFNTIRQDLIYLEEQHVFDYNYQSSGVNSWQSALQEVANSADLRYELKSDVYYEKVVAAMEHVLSIMKNDASFRPLDKYEQYRSGNLSDVPLDRVVFLVGTLDAANNSYFNTNPSFDDALRNPYYTGEKSLYDTDTTSSIDVISGDFNLGYSRFDYLVSYVLGIAVLYNTFVILLNLAARMFNILFLYIIAPPILASRPLDGGNKTSQWMKSFIVQLLGVFGSIIVMRLLLIFVPVVFDPSLVLIQNNPMLNYFGKAIILIAAYTVAKKAGSLLSGILSDTAGMSSAQAGDMTSAAQRTIGYARRAAGSAVRAAGAAIGFAASPLMNSARKPFDEYKKLGSGPTSSDIARQAQERIAVDNKVRELRSKESGKGGKGGGQGASQPPPGGPSRSNVLSDKNGSANIDKGTGAKDGVSSQSAQRPRASTQPKMKSPSLETFSAQASKLQSERKMNAGSGSQQKNVSSEPQGKSGSYGQSDVQAQSNVSGVKDVNVSQPGSQPYSKPKAGSFSTGGAKTGQSVTGSSQSASYSGSQVQSGISGANVQSDIPQAKSGSYGQSDVQAQSNVSGVKDVNASQLGSIPGAQGKSVSQPGSQPYSNPKTGSYSTGGAKTGQSVTGSSYTQQSGQSSRQMNAQSFDTGTAGTSSVKASAGTVSQDRQTSNTGTWQTRQRSFSQGSAGANSSTAGTNTGSADIPPSGRQTVQTNRQNAAPQTDINDFMRRTYRSYDAEISKDN